MDEDRAEPGCKCRHDLSGRLGPYLFWTLVRLRPPPPLRPNKGGRSDSTSPHLSLRALTIVTGSDKRSHSHGPLLSPGQCAQPGPHPSSVYIRGLWGPSTMEASPELTQLQLGHHHVSDQVWEGHHYVHVGQDLHTGGCHRHWGPGEVSARQAGMGPGRQQRGVTEDKGQWGEFSEKESMSISGGQWRSVSRKSRWMGRGDENCVFHTWPITQVFTNICGMNEWMNELITERWGSEGERACAILEPGATGSNTDPVFI